MTLAKSAKWRDRQRAYEVGELHLWEKAQREAVAPPATPPANPFDNYDAIRTPEGASWPEDGRHVPYMRWRLPFSTSR
jgi:hypothetical protein